MTDTAIDNQGLIYTLADLPEEPPSRYFSTGFAELDPHWMMDAGQFVVIGSKPGVGKTALVSQIIANVASLDCMVGFIDFESRRRKTKQRLRSLFKSRVHAGKKDKSNVEVYARMLADQSVLVATFDVQDPGKAEVDPSLDYILEIIDIMAVKGCKVVVIDPWNEMDHWRDRNESLTEYTGRAIKSLKRKARLCNITLIVCAHPAKPQDYAKKIESLYQISDSAHWYNKPDIGIILNRPKDEDTGRYRDELHIDVQKVRYQDDGFTTGEIILRFDRSTRRFSTIGSTNSGWQGTKAWQAPAAPTAPSQHDSDQIREALEALWRGTRNRSDDDSQMDGEIRKLMGVLGDISVRRLVPACERLLTTEEWFPTGQVIRNEVEGGESNYNNSQYKTREQEVAANLQGGGA